MTDVLHVTPALFGDRGMWGGGERFAVELARAQARLVHTQLVSLGPQERQLDDGELSITILPTRFHWKGHELNAISERLLGLIRGSRAVHVHQYNTALTSFCLLAGAALRTPVYVTDHGGSAPSLNRRLRLHRLVAQNLSVSTYALRFYPELRERSTVIFAGVDTDRFHPPAGPHARTPQVCCVARIMPHKGIDILIQALDHDTPLELYGRPYDAAYLAHLHRLARGKPVTFHHDADDAEIVSALQRSRVAVLPSVYRTYDGRHAPNAEYFGIALAEAMACGTPVVATRVGGMPEVLEGSRGGRIVAPGDAASLGAAIREIVEAPEEQWQAWSRACVEAVELRFTWRGVAERCLEAYGLQGSAHPTARR